MENEEKSEVNVSEDVSTDTDNLKAELEAEKAKNKDLGDKIYKLKKSNKEKVEPNASFDESSINRILDERKFYETNPDFLEHKEMISDLTSKWVSYEVAKAEVLQKDTTIAERLKTTNSNFTNWDVATNKTNYTIADLEKMSQWEYNKVKELQSKGEVTFTA